MKQRVTKVLGLLLAGVMTLGMLTACGGKNGGTEGGKDTSSASKETKSGIGDINIES